jgi:hypothetical protein
MHRATHSPDFAALNPGYGFSQEGREDTDRVILRQREKRERRMHIVMLVAFGLIALAAFVVVGKAIGSRGIPYNAPKLFIPVWLIASLLNSAIGIVGAGIPIQNEMAAFIPIFGIPAAVAWWIMRASGIKPRTDAPES